MRPVNKGDAPRRYTSYRDALPDLEERLDRYCSYCERRYSSGLAVEHISPKVLDPTRETDWDNFLLSCSICNSIKGNTETNDQDFVWPHRDNTLLAIQYNNGLVARGDALSDEVKEKTSNLIDLVGLDRHPGNPNAMPLSNRDSRYQDREEVWAIAKIQKHKLDKDNTESRRSDIADMARGWGFFGVWMTVFDDNPDVRNMLIEVFRGTARDCFDDSCDYIPRDGGHT